MYEENSYSYEYQNPPRRNPMATASVVFGILALLSCLIIYVSVPCGAMAVIFAILSRTDRPMPQKSKVGLICGICGMISTVIITISSFYYVLSDSTMRTFLEQYYQMYTGDFDFDLEEELGDLIPFLDFGSDTPSEEPLQMEPLEGGSIL